MSDYVLVSQDVSATVEFERYALCGWTRLAFVHRGEWKPDESTDETVSFMLPFVIPTVEHATYKRVIVNGTDATFHLAKTLDPATNAEAVNNACQNVDIMTFDGIHVVAQQIYDALLYVELEEVYPELTVELQFEYLHLKNVTEDIFFRQYWLLPRCSTSYREYTIFTSNPSCERWFPTALITKGIGIDQDCVYRIEVSVPQGYTAISGLPVNDDISMSEGMGGTAENSTFRFKWVSNEGLGVMPQHSFSLFAGEFELWDGTFLQKIKAGDKEKGRRILDDEDCMEDFARKTPYVLNNKAPVTYATLKGFGFLLEPTNITTSQCLESFRKLLDIDTPKRVFLIFLPLQPFQTSTNMAAQIRTQNYLDVKRCTAFTGSETYLHTSLVEPLTYTYHGMYFRSASNITVYSMDILHSYSDIDNDSRTMDCRLVVIYGLAALFTLRKWVNPSRDMHLDIMLQSYLVDQFIKRYMGINEHRVRLWARRDVFATITEIFGDPFPLCQNKGTSTSSHVLLADKAFVLKCHILPTILDALFTTSNFLPDSFFIQSMRRRLVAVTNANSATFRMDLNCVSKTKNSDSFAVATDGNNFWNMVSEEIVRRYIHVWNARPPNRLVLQNQLDANCKLEDILKRGVEHDHLSSIMKQYTSLVSSFVHGTGCPQMNMSFSVQLQRKGTSMDHLNFRVDVKSLQPPLDVQKNGRSSYSICSVASLAMRNLRATYSRLAAMLQLEEHSGGPTDIVFERLSQLFGLCGSDHCPNVPQPLDFADTTISIVGSTEIATLRRNMGLIQMWHDPVDLIGRDGNFLMGFGYIGPFPHSFCLGNGPIYDCLEVLRQHCDISSMLDAYIDNGSTYCGSYTFKNGFERIMGKGSLPIASNGGTPFWQSVHQQAVMIAPEKASVPLSAGVSKQWITTFKVDIVEDDGVRENVKVIGDLVPTSYKVNPRAERGRKKVAIKGIPEKDLEDAIDDTQRRSAYIGHHSESDRLVIEWMKMLFIGMHPELAQLDNRSVVAKICSKVRLPVLWMSVDSGFSLIARIRRCQSSSMWEQQLLSDNNIYGQLDSAAAMGSFGRSVNYTTCDNPIVRVAVSKLELMIRRHKIHPVVRARCLYSLVFIHNRDYREQESVQEVFTNYLTSFSLNNTGANGWHPSEARFMIDFFKALSLLRNRLGHSPQMVIDMLTRVLEGMNGVNYLVHATNIVECCSYLVIPPCALRHRSANVTQCLDVKRLWRLLWHLFRLDGIPGSGSCHRVLTASFLRCLSRQPVFLELCHAKFMNEKDLGFQFDFLYFIPRRSNIFRLAQGPFELGQTYYSKQVHISSIEALLRVLMTCAFMLEEESDMNADVKGTHVRMIKVTYATQLKRVQKFAGIHDATRCCVDLCEELIEPDLKVDVWDAYARLIEDLSQAVPILFVNLECPLARKTRDLLYAQLRPYAISNRHCHVQIFLKIRSAITLLFGYGYYFDDDIVPDAKLVDQRIDMATSGMSMPRIAAFRRVHGEGARSSTSDWMEVAVEAINALKELPQARWFIYDPELSYAGYRSIVRNPMWLTKIEQKALEKQYAMPMQFKADMALIFKNAKSVNKADSMPFADAVVLEEQFDTLWPAIVRTFQQHAKARRM
ncbi:uncharacterized protein BXIN_2352 [Babesia sp. Xinjiang]|uniref:uncharacterized protein n=1 Tax=Babesia sp. Xinjiang TaxID=462227 RepID=UPI000A22CBCC|nr:uncharacterized protein BXIN_2352 [Babesia sp. Xinjiang]ORM40679.1 hypothetical protein BXIN_2352 [Babesia sp. Xinjiang]